MRARLVAIAVAFVSAIVLGSCTSHSTESDRVADVVRHYLDAFARKDAAAMASDYSPTCHARPAELQAELDRLAQPLRVDIQSIDVTMPSTRTANAVAHGTLFVGARALPLTGPAGNEEFHLIEVGTRWKIANCPGQPAG
jgi:hypothetical protein